jgi:hypothetical protein
MIFIPPPQFAQCSSSRSNTRLSSLAQLSHTGRRCAQLASHSQAQGNGQRQNPLTHRHVRDDVVDQVRCRLWHASGSA